MGSIGEVEGRLIALEGKVVCDFGGSQRKTVKTVNVDLVWL